MVLASSPAAGLAGRAPALEVRDIKKGFVGVPVLKGVSFAVQPGEVHCLCGENGAGKSTMIRIMAGSLKPDDGSILLDGVPVQVTSPQHGLKLGIGVVYQELELIPNLSIMENMVLGREPRTVLGTIDWRAVRQLAVATLDLMGVSLSVDRLVSTLTVAQAQLVAIAKILAMRPRILVLDEPTAALSGGDLETLFTLIERLRAEGVAIIYISHRLEEIFRLGDKVTVLRDGLMVQTSAKADVTEDELIRAMVGRETEQRFPPLPSLKTDKVVLSVRGLTTATLRDVSFELRAGEILGCTGLAGCGHDALARALVGLEPIHAGEIVINGKPAKSLSPRRSQALGLSLVPEDRKGQGLVIGATIAENATYSILEKNANLGVINGDRLADVVAQYYAGLRIRARSPEQTVSTLSGGNQQKVVLARVLSTEPDVLVLDEPTRGIDVGAKAEIYQLMVKLIEDGKGVLLISSEMIEVMAMSHRLMVLSEGAQTGLLEPPYRDTEILTRALPLSTRRDAGSAIEGGRA